MHQFKFASMLLMAMILASCGGGNSNVPAKPKFSSQVSFGDSLSDVGSYRVGIGIGTGEFTVNAASGVPTNWTELTAPQFGLAAPCAAETGVDNGSGATPGTPTGSVIPVANNAACTGYAQGGARVTSPIGIGNKALGSGGFFLTVPVATQISNHLTAHGGSFSGNEIVFVMAGANDVFYQVALVSAGAITSASAVAAVQTAATELAADVNNQITGKGAKYVVVMNVPDIGSTPQVTSIANATVQAQTKALFDALVTAFNATLKASLPDSANVLNVDAFTASHDEVANKDKYLLSNVTATACNLAVTNNTSFFCTSLNSLTLNTGDVSHYLFADAVHPTPYGHALFAQYVLQAMTNKGWY